MNGSMTSSPGAGSATSVWNPSADPRRRGARSTGRFSTRPAGSCRACARSWNAHWSFGVAVVAFATARTRRLAFLSAMGIHCDFCSDLRPRLSLLLPNRRGLLAPAPPQARAGFFMPSDVGSAVQTEDPLYRSLWLLVRTADPIGLNLVSPACSGGGVSVLSRKQNVCRHSDPTNDRTRYRRAT